MLCACIRICGSLYLARQHWLQSRWVAFSFSLTPQARKHTIETGTIIVMKNATRTGAVTKPSNIAIGSMSAAKHLSMAGGKTATDAGTATKPQAWKIKTG